jgi:6-phosphofructokinase 1
MPPDFIRAVGYGITAKARRYLAPLIAGEAYPRYADGLPVYVMPKFKPVKKKLATYSISDK